MICLVFDLSKKQFKNYLAQGQFLQLVGLQNVLSESNMIWENDGTFGTLPLFLLLYFWLFQALLKTLSDCLLDVKHYLLFTAFYLVHGAIDYLMVHCWFHGVVFVLYV